MGLRAPRLTLSSTSFLPPIQKNITAASSDTARADRQQRMLKAVFNQMKSTGQIANIPKIYKAVSDCIETDLSFEQICALSLVAVRMDAEQLDRHMIAGRFASLYSRDVWLVDREKLIDLIKDVFNVDAEIAEDVDGEAILAAAAENNAAIQGELYGAALLYNEAKSITANYSSSLSSGTKSAISSLKSKLAAAIRRECKPYLDQYSISYYVGNKAESFFAQQFIHRVYEQHHCVSPPRRPRGQLSSLL